MVEADEYDYSFLPLQPEVAVITNVDYDHPDLFPDQDAYDAAFAAFAAQVEPERRPGDRRRRPWLRPAAGARGRSRARVVTFGEGRTSTGGCGRGRRTGR